MAALIKSKSKLADSKNKPQIGDEQSNIADAAITTATLSAPNIATLSAPTPTALTLTYTTDDPGTTADGAITFADGDAAMSAAEEYELADELETVINALITLITELKADHAIQVTLNTELIADHATFVTDVTDNNTKINAILDVLEEHGLMTAS